jgi:hypothetical protein
MRPDQGQESHRKLGANQARMNKQYSGQSRRRERPDPPPRISGYPAPAEQAIEALRLRAGRLAQLLEADGRLDVVAQDLAGVDISGEHGVDAFAQQRSAERGIEPHIPVLDRSMQTNGVFTRNDFTFNRANNAFICPGGKSLPLAYERDNGILIYRARVRDCSEPLPGHQYARSRRTSKQVRAKILMSKPSDQ